MKVYTSIVLSAIAMQVVLAGSGGGFATTKDVPLGVGVKHAGPTPPATTTPEITPATTPEITPATTPVTTFAPSVTMPAILETWPTPDAPDAPIGVPTMTGVGGGPPMLSGTTTDETLCPPLPYDYTPLTPFPGVPPPTGSSPPAGGSPPNMAETPCPSTPGLGNTPTPAPTTPTAQGGDVGNTPTPAPTTPTAQGGDVGNTPTPAPTTPTAQGGEGGNGTPCPLLPYYFSTPSPTTPGASGDNVATPSPTTPGASGDNVATPSPTTPGSSTPIVVEPTPCPSATPKTTSYPSTKEADYPANNIYAQNDRSRFLRA